MTVIVWVCRIGIFTVLAMLSIGCGIDAASTISPALSLNLPDAFRSQSLNVSVKLDLAGNDFTKAYKDASAAVQSRPLDPAAMYVMGLAANGFGNEKVASSAIAVAAGLGWRNIPAQVAILRGAIQQRQWDVAARRVAAIVRVDQLDLMPPGAMKGLIASPEGRVAAAHEFSFQPNGWVRLAGWLEQDLGPQYLAQFVSVLPDSTKMTDCTALADQAKALIANHEFGHVDSVWRGGCTRGHATGNSLEFPSVTTDGVAGPYDWVFPSEGAISWSTRSGPGGLYILARNADPIRRVLAERFVRFSTGDHTIYIKYLDAHGSGQVESPNNRGLSISASCVQFSPLRHSPLDVKVKWGDAMALEVPAGCDMEKVSAIIKPGSISGFRFDGE